MNYRALTTPAPYPRAHRSFNARLIPEYLAELARAGRYYESKAL